MENKTWQMWIMRPNDLDEDERARLVVQAGISTMSWHDTEADAKDAAECALRRLNDVSDINWTACYAVPANDGNLRSSDNAVPRRISTKDLAD